MKKSVLMIVLLLAISSLMAAMSYSSATVTSAMTGSVVSTDEALLALNVGKHNATTIEDGVLKIDFNKGNNNSSFGLQKNSEYIWNELFTIENNSENIVYATIKTEYNLPEGISVWVKSGNDNWTEIDSIRGADVAKLTAASGVSAQMNEMAKVDVKIVVESNASLGNFAPNLVVSGEAVD
ncbi:DUF1102 domain-containing protein [Sporosarcina sp. SAFN-015]|uniref:DUF1102 domain-containing protein n=1 Tax=Sporosarcina sp. SAFN-015 TaxID=3387274 RepID=UPI003F7D8211